MTFDDFFHAATGYTPFEYQRRLASGTQNPSTSPAGLCQSPARRSQLIAVPTGLGKTAAVVLAWLWNRLRLDDTANPQEKIGSRPPESLSANSSPALRPPPWPRRLVYCLPMRTLVEQTEANVRDWLANLWRHRAELELSPPALEELRWLAGDGTPNCPRHSPIVLMGGEELAPALRDWDLYPEKPALLIGTQDMLLSRALNRGYGLSRYRWPMHFALLHNDCLWVLDETQLLGVGLETSAQLDAFRHEDKLPTVGPCLTWWMSATLDEARLATVDHAPPASGWPRIELDAADLALPQVHDRVHAAKPLGRAGVRLTADSESTYATSLAEVVLRQHQAGSLTLVVLNRVDRAQAVYSRLRQRQPDARIALIHSRFRPEDRQRQQALLHAEGDRIVVATQAVEAGVDVSARTLITELAPWSSLVQRFGRCNRRGEFKNREARVLWVDIETSGASGELALPYTVKELDQARRALTPLHDVGPQTLRAIHVPASDVIRPVLRRKDLVELFDTTPDLAGHDLDISRYIRDGDDTDVQVFWRDLRGALPTAEEPQPSGDELCPVSLPGFREFLQKLQKRAAKEDSRLAAAWVWDALAESWQPVQTARAGGIYLLDISAGGYNPDLGWYGTRDEEPNVCPLPPSSLAAENGYAADGESLIGRWIPLQAHTDHVLQQTLELSRALTAELASIFSSANPAEPLTEAARWHDLGKAHPAFQEMLCGNDPSRRTTLWAKSGLRSGRCSRRFFRHELASALAWLQTAAPDTVERDLVAYLIAAHHGKVRLSLRSFPGEEPPADQPELRIARGVCDGDPLPREAFAALGVTVPPTPIRLSLEPMEMGRSSNGAPSWLARMIALRDRFGPFRLAWLETLLRAADARASRQETASATLPT